MIKKLLLIFSFVALLVVAFSGTSDANHKKDTQTYPTNIAGELHLLHDLYTDGIISEEEFEEAKAVLLGSGGKKRKKKSSFFSVKEWVKKRGTAAERRDAGLKE